MPMPRIRIDHDQVAIMARVFDQQSQAIARMTQTCESDLDVLRHGDWVGQGAKAFYAEMDIQVLPALHRLVRALHEAGRVTAQISAVMQQAEAEASAILTTTGSASFGLLPQAGGATNARLLNPVDLLTELSRVGTNFDVSQLMFQSNRGLIDFFALVVKDRRATAAFMIAVGRWLNSATDSVGHVKQLNELYRALVVEGIPYRGTIDRLLNSKLFGGGLVGADAVFGALADWNESRYGTDWLKTGGVNAVKSLVEFMVADAHPAAAITLLVNSGVQVAGEVQVGVQRTLADWVGGGDPAIMTALRQNAEMVNTAVRQSDLGNVTRQLGEAVYETYANGLGGVWEVGKAYAEGAVHLWQSPSLQTLTAVSQVINRVGQAHLGDIVGIAAGPVLSPAGLRNLGEAGQAAVRVVDGLGDWMTATTASAVNLSLGLAARGADVLPLSSQLHQVIDRSAVSAMQEVQHRATEQINAFALPAVQ